MLLKDAPAKADN